MSAYLIAQVNIINNEAYKEYVKLNSGIIEKFGGKFLVRGGKCENVYGNWPYDRNVIIEFPSYNDAINWYNSDEYKPVKKIREDNAESNVLIIDGIQLICWIT